MAAAQDIITGFINPTQITKKIFEIFRASPEKIPLMLQKIYIPNLIGVLYVCINSKVSNINVFINSNVSKNFDANQNIFVVKYDSVSYNLAFNISSL